MDQRSYEWFAARRQRVTASMMGAVLGLSPHVTRAQMMRRMVREALGEPSEFEGNIATDYGNRNEPGALIEYQMITGRTVSPVGFIPVGEWAGASPDGLLGDDGILEIKCPFSLRDKAVPDFKTLEEQPHYYAQVQFQLWATGREYAHFFQWAPQGYMLETVEADQEYIYGIVQKALAFYNEFTEALKNPAEYTAPQRKVIDTPRAQAIVREWDELGDAIARAEERKKELLEEMARLAGDQNADFAGRKLTRVEKAGAISYAKAIKELLPDANLEPWRGKPSSFWQLR
jgi:putative phage-type endonuclease